MDAKVLERVPPNHVALCAYADLSRPSPGIFEENGISIFYTCNYEGSETYAVYLDSLSESGNVCVEGDYDAEVI